MPAGGRRRYLKGGYNNVGFVQTIGVLEGTVIRIRDPWCSTDFHHLISHQNVVFSRQNLSMADNTIPTRVADFMKGHPPFNLLPATDLYQVATRVVVQYAAEGETIFTQGQPLLAYFYLVREGSVDLIREGQDKDQLIDRCGEGEVFGIRALLAEEHYALSCRASEELLLYAIPTAVFEPFWQNNARVAYYLATCFAAGVRSRKGSSLQGRLFISQPYNQGGDNQLLEVQQLPFKHDPLTCPPTTSIKQAAEWMGARKVGSIIVINEDDFPIGIVTYKDMARQTATGKVAIDEPVSLIMSSPVQTIAQERTFAEAQIRMLRHNIHHLVATTDGTNTTPVQGVVSHHDLLVLQGNSPAVIVRAILRTSKPEKLDTYRGRAEELLQKYLYQEVSIAYIAEIMSQVNDAIIDRAIRFALDKHPDPPADFCWLGLGSEGRKEQLLRTDQDNALVFADVPAEEYETTKAYFLAFAKTVNDLLADAGFVYCPADMMASNPQWCMSLQEWKDQFSNWIFKPGAQEILYANIFFDYRPLYGQAELSAALTDHIYECLEDRQLFLNFMAQHATISPPPLSFFRSFIVEEDGEHKDEFDIKKRAMMPLTDIARILTLDARLHGINSTIERFEKLAALDEKNREIYEMAADAYEVLMRIRALQGLKHKNSGRFVRTADLTKMQRALLRNSFRPVKKLQESLRLRFQLSYFG